MHECGPIYNDGLLRNQYVVVFYLQKTVCRCIYVYMFVYVCMYVCMYTDDVRRFFRTLKSNGPIMYIPLYVRIYFSLTKTLKFM